MPDNPTGAEKAKLGILAGRGGVPVRIIQACRDQGRPYFVIAFEEQTPEETVADTPHAWVRLGAAGAALNLFKENNVEEIVMAGGIKRPSLKSLKPDLWAAKVLAKAGAKALGDDGLLGAIVGQLEKEGFRVVGIEDVLTDVLAVEGRYSRKEPNAQGDADIARGIEVAKGLGALDVGQGAVVQQGLVLAVEAIEGTDAMLSRIPGLLREGGGGVLVKVAKPGQEGRADLPTIGVDTVRRVAEAGLAGIAVEAGKALVVDGQAVRKAADDAGLFVVCLKVEEGDG